ncbi:MAG: hypothetical protein SZ59_C0001G0038 [candidate division TM6 bacterium GW2011_GWF2_28_16]|jgi:hypothetical protein|nr:MAG: hypothetical protein SZ59_C0001G0038 [candidate division TM6 bacterium GW2011_GWF2_28_16]
MKVLVIFISIILFFTKLWAYQPPEYGLFTANVLEPNKANVDSSKLAENNIMPKIRLLKEKRADGSPSNVYYLRDIADFLYFAVKKDLPIVLNIYPENNINKENFQKLADAFLDKVSFLSFNKVKNTELAGLIKLFVQFEEINNVSLDDNKQLFFLIKPKSVSIENDLVNFSKGSLVLLGKPGEFNFDEIKSKIESSLQ